MDDQVEWLDHRQIYGRDGAAWVEADGTGEPRVFLPNVLCRPAVIAG